MPSTEDAASPSELVDAGIAELGDWRGAALDDPTGGFDASLSAGTRRVIDLREGDKLDEDAVQLLGHAADGTALVDLLDHPDRVGLQLLRVPPRCRHDGPPS